MGSSLRVGNIGGWPVIVFNFSAFGISHCDHLNHKAIVQFAKQPLLRDCSLRQTGKGLQLITTCQIH